MAIQTWGGPGEGGSELLTIGNNAMKSDFHGEAGAFTLYDHALSSDQIVAQYAEERGRYVAEEAVR